MSENLEFSVVNSYNEWDPLEEVIVGSVKGATKVGYEPSINAYYPDKTRRKHLDEPFELEEIAEAEKQLDGFAAILSSLGICVQRPSKIDFSAPIETPCFKARNGNNTACPRDVLLIIGNQIIEATMAQRARFFEYLAYRKLVNKYFLSGAKWYSAPKPSMSDDMYVGDFNVVNNSFDADTNNAFTNKEPCFDAASFIRLGKDIFYQPDLVTNDLGAHWLQRHLGCEYRLHRLKFADKHPPQHIDTTLVPIRPGLVLINPERPCKDDGLDLFKNNNWKIISAPPSIRSVEFHSPEVSNWISMNFISLDEETVIVEEQEEPMIKLLESLDCKVITCAFDKVYKFGGGFHCCTADIRRKGQLKSYFPSLDK